MVGVSVLGSIGLSAYILYDEKGYLSKIDIISIIFGSLLLITIMLGLFYYRNRPKKGE